MEKLGLLIKQISEKRIKDSIKESDGVFVIRYSGLSSPSLSILRRALKNSHASLFVVKNNVARRAFTDLGKEMLLGAIEGPCGLVFVKEEPVSASKVLCNFSKNYEQLKLEGGFLKDKILDKKDIEAMSRLASREVLRAQVVIALNSPIARLAMVLNENLRKLVYCLEQIKSKKTT